MSLDYTSTLATSTGYSGNHPSAVHNGEHNMNATVTYTVRKYDPSAPEGWGYALHTCR